MTDLPLAAEPSTGDAVTGFVPGSADNAPSITALGAQVQWTDRESAAQARRHALADLGTLAGVAEWLAATQGRWPPSRPGAVRLLSVGAASPRARAAAKEARAAVVEIAVPGSAERTDTAASAVAAGVAVTDAQVDSGADLLLLTTGRDPSTEVAAGVLVGLYTATEPVALLPRGADAVDTDAWIARAVALRDLRRTAVDLRDDPDELLAAAGGPAVAVAVGVVLRAAARRVPVVVDGPGAVAAALLCHDVSFRASHWCRVADTSPDPVQSQAADELGAPPLLGQGTRTSDGAAALLCVALLRSVAVLAAHARPHDQAGSAGGAA